MAWVVFAFECRRAMILSRLVVMAVLAAFPPAVLWLIQREGGRFPTREAWQIALFVLIPEMVCLLGLLAWATPVIHAEVEAKTWPYLVVRPVGKTAILAGKYAAAVFWTMLTGWLSLLLALAVLAPHEQAFPAGRVMAALVALSCVAYGALFVLLGVAFLRRAMIVAVAYTLLEFAVRWIPAMVKQLTVQYHLQGLLVRWMGWDDRVPQIQEVFGTDPAWQHVLILVGYAAAMLAASALILRRRELVTATEV